MPLANPLKFRAFQYNNKRHPIGHKKGGAEIHPAPPNNCNSLKLVLWNNPQTQFHQLIRHRL